MTEGAARTRVARTLVFDRVGREAVQAQVCVRLREVLMSGPLAPGQPVTLAALAEGLAARLPAGEPPSHPSSRPRAPRRAPEETS